MRPYKIAIISLLVTVSTGNALKAQEYVRIKAITENSIHVGFLGGASLLSIKYERVIAPFGFGFIAAGAGIGVGMEGTFGGIGLSESYEEHIFFGTIPHHITVNFGKGKHFLETGIGGAVLVGKPSQDYVGYPTLGYRFQNTGSIKSNFRMYVQIPIAGNPGPDVLFIPLGISIGTSF